MTHTSYIFWDADNTLTANGDLHWRKHVETARRYGIEIDPSFQKRIYHNNGAQNWTWLKDELGLDVDQQHYLLEIDQWYADHVSEIEFRPGVPEAIDLFTEAGCRQCVVSNGRRNSVMLALNAKSIVPRFEFILCKEDYEGRKPDPAPYLAARIKMEVIVVAMIDPTHCLAIEDDPLGVASAHAARLPVIHRRLREDDPPAQGASINVFSEDDFLKAVRSYL